MWEYNNARDLYHWGIPGMKWHKKKAKKYNPSDPENLRKAAIKGDAKAQVDIVWKDGPPGYSKKLTKKGNIFVDEHGNKFEGTLAQATKKKWQYDKAVAQKNAEKALAEYKKKHSVSYSVKKAGTDILSSGKKMVGKLINIFD